MDKETKNTSVTEDEIKKEAIRIVSQERTDWQNAVCFVTEKVAFDIRNLIRQLRRNYWGVFEEPTDPNTGRKKIWIPLTQTIVHSVVKNIDLDTKDINFRAKKTESIGLTQIVRSLVRNSLDRLGEDGTAFGEELDMFEKNLAIDGTAVWKTLEHKENGKTKITTRNVDILNIYIDPTARSIQDAYRFTERSLMTLSEIKSMDWMNTDDVKGYAGFHRSDENLTTATVRSTELADVWEMWGKIPKWLITGKKEDKESGDEIDGRIIVSGLERSGSEQIHLIEKAKDCTKPYEEAWYSRVNNRWYGLGVAEMIMMLQLYLNTIVNIRITRSFVSQLGLFKIRKNAGLTPQMFSKLSANGAILVNNMEDVEQMVMQEASQASYNDENNIVGWAQKVTSAFETVTGESLPASTPATNAVISNRAATSAFELVKEGVGMFLQRWITRQYIPKLMKTVKIGDIVRVSGSIDEMAQVNTNLANMLVKQELIKRLEARKMFDPAEVERVRQSLIEKLGKQGDKFVKLLQTPDMMQFEVQVDITNESVDKGVLAQNLITALQAAPQLQGIIIPQIFDVMGLNIPAQLPVQQPGANGGLNTPASPQGQSGQGQVMDANTMQR